MFMKPENPLYANSTAGRLPKLPLSLWTKTVLDLKFSSTRKHSQSSSPMTIAHAFLKAVKT